MDNFPTFLRSTQGEEYTGILWFRELEEVVSFRVTGISGWTVAPSVGTVCSWISWTRPRVLQPDVDVSRPTDPILRRMSRCLFEVLLRCPPSVRLPLTSFLPVSVSVSLWSLCLCLTLVSLPLFLCLFLFGTIVVER